MHKQKPTVLSRSKIKYLLALFPIRFVVVLDLRRQAFVLRLAYGKNCCASYIIFERDSTLVQQIFPMTIIQNTQ